MAVHVELYPVRMGTNQWWRLQVIGLELSAFLDAVRQSAILVALKTGIIGARPKTTGATACGYLNAPGDDAVLNHAMAVAARHGVELTLGEAEVLSN